MAAWVASLRCAQVISSYTMEKMCLQPILINTFCAASVERAHTHGSGVSQLNHPRVNVNDAAQKMCAF